MIDYETFYTIKHYHEQAHLRISQIARTLGLHPRTVAHCRQSGPRTSKLDPFKPRESCAYWKPIPIALGRSSNAYERTAFTAAIRP
jgi:hypothetical protein